MKGSAKVLSMVAVILLVGGWWPASAQPQGSPTNSNDVPPCARNFVSCANDDNADASKCCTILANMVNDETQCVCDNIVVPFMGTDEATTINNLFIICNIGVTPTALCSGDSSTGSGSGSGDSSTGSGSGSGDSGTGSGSGDSGTGSGSGDSSTGSGSGSGDSSTGSGSGDSSTGSGSGSGDSSTGSGSGDSSTGSGSGSGDSSTGSGSSDSSTGSGTGTETGTGKGSRFRHSSAERMAGGVGLVSGVALLIWAMVL